MSLVTSLARFASSRQGRKLVHKAKTYAQSPQGREKIDQVTKAVKNFSAPADTKRAPAKKKPTGKR